MLCFKHFGYATYCLPDTNKKLYIIMNRKTLLRQLEILNDTHDT